MKKYIALIIIALILVLGGMVLGFEMTMRNIHCVAGDEGIVLVDIYGQQYVYEE